MEAKQRKVERLERKIGQLRQELDKIRSQREEKVKQRLLQLEILKDQKQDVEEKIHRAQDVLGKTNHGMRQEYKDAMIYSGAGAGITTYILNVESQLCRALHGMYVLNRLYAGRQKTIEGIKLALHKVIKLKQEEGGVSEFRTVKLLCQKEFEMQEFSDWIEEQCHMQCELLSSLKEQLDQALLRPRHDENHLQAQHESAVQPSLTGRQLALPAINETTVLDTTADQRDDDDDEEDSDEDASSINKAENDDVFGCTIGKRVSPATSRKEDPASSSGNNVNNASLMSFFMQHAKLDFEQQQRWLEAGDDSESYCTLFIGDLQDTRYQTMAEQPAMNDDSDERPTVCQPVAQSA